MSFGQPGACDTCGAATKIVKEGEPCDLLDETMVCAGGCHCLEGQCKKLGGGWSSAVCDNGETCFPPNACSDGVCAAGKMPCAFHEDCPTGNCLCANTPCFDGGEPAGVCGETQLSALGESCSNTPWPSGGQVWRPCAPGLVCVWSQGPGFSCVPLPQAPASCESSDVCRFPASCIEGACKEPSPTRCGQ
jgi:hypothetical protein